MSLTLNDIQTARQVLEGFIKPTAVIPAPGLCSARSMWLKAENLQKTGSFKLRGAYYRVSLLNDEERARGVIACSAGNHAQGVALSAREAGIRCVICMPEGAPISKVERTRAYGAEVVLCPGVFDDAYARALELQQEHGYVFLHPFNDKDVIAGQGTIGLELSEQIPDLDLVLVPVGGGGLISGIAYALKQLRPSCQIIGVEPRGAASMKQSLQSGRLQTLEHMSTIADGVAVKRPGEDAFNLCREYVDYFVTVTENEIASAMLRLMEDYKVIAEGAGAVAVAAAMYGKVETRGLNVACIVSGGNVDVNMMSRVISKGLRKTGRVMDIQTILDDKPRQLEHLLEVVAEQGANILSVQHERDRDDTEVGQCAVALKLETRGHEHIEELTKVLRDCGYEQLTIDN